MAVKAIVLDDNNTQHLIIGLNRDNIDSLLRGDVFRLPRGIVPALTETSDIVVLFAETDDNLAKRLTPASRPIGWLSIRDKSVSLENLVKRCSRGLPCARAIDAPLKVRRSSQQSEHSEARRRCRPCVPWRHRIPVSPCTPQLLPRRLLGKGCTARCRIRSPSRELIIAARAAPSALQLVTPSVPALPDPHRRLKYGSNAAYKPSSANGEVQSEYCAQQILLHAVPASTKGQLRPVVAVYFQSFEPLREFHRLCPVFSAASSNARTRTSMSSSSIALAPMVQHNIGGTHCAWTPAHSDRA
jgi:hypothetical protein